MPVIPALGSRGRRIALSFKPASKFLTSKGYTVRPCLKPRKEAVATDHSGHPGPHENINAVVYCGKSHHIAITIKEKPKREEK